MCYHIVTYHISVTEDSSSFISSSAVSPLSLSRQSGVMSNTLAPVLNKLGPTMNRLSYTKQAGPLHFSIRPCIKGGKLAASADVAIDIAFLIDFVPKKFESFLKLFGK